MGISIFRRDTEWVVLTDKYELTLHEDLASAMNHAAAEIRSSDHPGAAQSSCSSLHDS